MELERSLEDEIIFERFSNDKKLYFFYWIKCFFVWYFYFVSNFFKRFLDFFNGFIVDREGVV